MPSNFDLNPKGGPQQSGGSQSPDSPQHSGKPQYPGGSRYPGFETACVIVDKVYFQCKQRECIEDVKVRVPDSCIHKHGFLDVIFNPGEIKRGTLVITDMPDKPGFRRVRFKVKITFTVRVKNATGSVESITGELPLIQKDIVLYIPGARDEFTFKILVETLSESLTKKPIFDDGALIFTIGVFIITKVVGKVQLLIPEYGFCPVPCECVDFQEDGICEEFEMKDFPDFFPEQLQSPMPSRGGKK